MKRITFNFLAIILLLLFTSGIVRAQAPVDYRDVAVIVNDSSSNSIAVGNYFAKARKIPPQNIIHFKGDTSEIIDSITFEKIRTQIEDTLKENTYRKTSLNKSINYLVTTKGVPLKINRATACDQFYSGKATYKYTYVACASFESELMLVLGKYNNHIGKGDLFYISGSDTLLTKHPYYDTIGNFSRSKFDIFLVTRLDGFTRKNIYTLIDHSSPNTVTNKDSAQFEFDLESGNPKLTIFGDTSYYPMNRAMAKAAVLLSKRGWKTILDTGDTYLRKQKNILGYFSWGPSDDQGKKLAQASPQNSWLNSSLANVFYSFTGYSFNPPTNTGKAWAAKTIAEGATGVSAYVYEPTSLAMPDPRILYSHYTDTTMAHRYNLAESFYSAFPTMSWMTTIIGDPKTSIVTHIPPMPAPKVDTVTKICKGVVRVINASKNEQGNYNWFMADSTTLKTYGQPLDSTNKYWKASGKTFTLLTGAAGTFTYTYVNENIKGAAFRQFKYTVNVCTGIDVPAVTGIDFEVYPNPAYKQFTLAFNGAHTGNISVRVTDMLGREIFSRNFSETSSVQENIDMGASPAGVYFVTLTNGNQRAVKKVIMR